MASVNEIARQFGPKYVRQFGPSMLPSHLNALKDLQQCRTEKMGCHQQTCLKCGHTQTVYHSCKNRACPQCYFKRTEKWINLHTSRLLPVHYFHLVFTLPSQLRRIIRGNQTTLFLVLFQAAIKSLQSLAADKRYVGGKLGAMAILHSWSGAMVYHPHLHLFVPGCGVGANGEIALSRKQYLVPVKALSAKFRGCFLAMARKTLPEVDFSLAGDVKKWIVFLKPVKANKSQTVLRYLGRYLHRMAIANSSIIKMDPQSITFRYKK